MTAAKKRIQVDLGGRIAPGHRRSAGPGPGVCRRPGGRRREGGMHRHQYRNARRGDRAIQAAGGTAHPIAADVTNSQRVDEVVDEVVKLWGGLDILVNNAGITRDNLHHADERRAVGRRAEHQPQGHFSLHPRGLPPAVQIEIWPDHQYRQRLRPDGQPGQANYSASKAGVIGLTRTVSRELASRGVTVNAVAPGFIATDMTDKLGEEMLGKIKEEIPLKRLGLTQDVSDAVLFLASDAAEFITGQVLTVDGGLRYNSLSARNSGKRYRQGNEKSLYLSGKMKKQSSSAGLYAPRTSRSLRTCLKIVIRRSHRWPQLKNV